MAMTVSATPSLTQAYPLLRATTQSHLCVQPRLKSLPPRSPSHRLQFLKTKNSEAFAGCSAKKIEFGFGRALGFSVEANNGGGESGNAGDDDEAAEARGESTMPERFRHLTKEAPARPVRWPWLIALPFLIYAWRTVLLELANWRKAALAIARFVGYLSKLALALIFHFIGDPITSLIRCVETGLYTIRAFYSSIVAYAPVRELTMIILLTSAVLAISEATVPESVNNQPYLLTLSGIIGFVAVNGLISEPAFWLLLFGLFSIGRFVRKRDYVSSALPAASVLAAVGEPWIRVTVVTLYTALAIAQHSKKQSEVKKEQGAEAKAVAVKRLPLPLLGVALAMGIHFAAKWAGYRHLTWMIA